MIGGGHNALQKTYDAFFKVKILKQSTGAVKMPVTVSFVPTFAIGSAKSTDADNFDPSIIKSGETVKIGDRLSYVLQLLIGRKFSEGFSLQIMPTFIHADNISFNHFKDGIYKRDIFAIGVAGNQKISKRMSLNAEYYYQLPGSEAHCPQCCGIWHGHRNRGTCFSIAIYKFDRANGKIFYYRNR